MSYPTALGEKMWTLFNLRDISKNSCSISLAIARRLNRVFNSLRGNYAEIDLSNADLSNADLSRANLANADFANANLAGALLSRATLLGATFLGADLEGTDLSNADLRFSIVGGEHEYLKCEHANFQNAIIDDERLLTQIREGNAASLPILVKSRKELAEKLEKRGYKPKFIDRILSYSVSPE